jgi:hypothetical protein
MKMAKEDLIPLNTRTKEEQKKIARKGGKKSGEVRKQKKMMKDTLQMLLDLTIKDGEATNPESIKSLADIQNANLTVDQAILLAQIKKAVKGDTQSATFIRDTSGNKLAEEVKVGEIDDTIREIEQYVSKK